MSEHFRCSAETLTETIQNDGYFKHSFQSTHVMSHEFHCTFEKKT